MYSNPYFDPAVEVEPDRNGTACPHCEWRFLTEHGLSSHLDQHHPAADAEHSEVVA